MRHHRLTRSAVLGLVLAALVAPAAAAQAQDLRTPDARETSSITGSVGGSVSPVLPADLRSPDARETISNGVTAGTTDLRTPDTRDAAEGRGTFNAPEVALIEVPTSSPAAADGMDWGDAGIGAGT